MVDLGGRPTPVKVAHLRLCHSAACSWRWRICAKPRRWCSMRTGGRSACGAAAASAGSTTISRPRSKLIFTGKARQYNRKFLQMASHYLIEPVACTPARRVGEGAGREPGRSCAREHLHAAAALHGSGRAQRAAGTALRAIGAERSRTPSSASAPAGRCSKPRSARCWCRWRPVRGLRRDARSGSARPPGALDRNRYSVDCRYAGKTVSLRTYAERIVAVADGQDRRRACAQLRARSHLLRSLALRGGAGEEARRAAQRRAVQGLGAAAGAAGDARSAGRQAPAGDRQFVTILADHRRGRPRGGQRGLRTGLGGQAISASYVLNALNRFKPQPAAEVVQAPERAAAQG